ncbi:MAG: chromosome segregation protein SMC [Pseudomonadota bacterium]|nr:chromosome segregation protein SMC [Pseudomonadota bacterium]
MHLKSIKLAGFKSFAEPTVIPVGGRLVGVVGPNGCGKSNVIDAVRWVLGESSARHLRGETMQDVIFGGTATRKPQGRASVELLFDNTSGRAPGQWGQYAELSVRRVLTRDGDSQYFINNLHVRRRDVQDIFLGTGLGPRAYAIVEQGTISRIIESRPEEIRVFLEEAAGVSKYRERRRETESRLADSRANLLRTEDVQRELGGRIESLQGQAAVAGQYGALRARLAGLQDMLFLSRKRDADTARGRALQELERTQNESEAETARLREAERLTEQARQTQLEASDGLRVLQGRLYEVDSELGRLRQSIENLRGTRSRAESQRAALAREIIQDRTRRDEEEQRERTQVAALADAGQRLLDVRARALLERDALPPAERRARDVQAELNALRAELSRIEQAASVARTERRNSERQLQQWQERVARNARDSAALQVPDLAALAHLGALVRDEEIRAAILDCQAEARARAQTGAEAALGAARQRLAEADGATRRCVAELEALTALQARTAQRGDAREFLQRQGLEHAARFWQGIAVDAGWEDAVEAVLGGRLNAVQLGSLGDARAWGADPAAGGQSFFAPGPALLAPAAAAGLPSGAVRLRERVRALAAPLAPVLDAWLDAVWCAPDLDTALSWAGRLDGGQVLVTPGGHAVTAHLLRFFSPRTEVHGALARAREIEALAARRLPLEAALQAARAEVAGRETGLRAVRAALEGEQLAARECRARQHRCEVERTRLAGLAERHQLRSRELARDREEVAVGLEHEQARVTEHGQALARLEEQIRDQQRALQARESAWREASQALDMARSALQAAEKAEQEAVYLERSAQERLRSCAQSRQALEARLREREPQLAALDQELGGIDTRSLEDSLQQQLALRAEREAALLAARAELDAHGAAVHEHERARLAAEQALGPLRERIQDLRLKEQEARINFDRAAESLQERGADEAAVAALLEARGRSSGLAQEIGQVEKAVDALGPVNLAALAELETARERKGFLDAQVADLAEATETLESAMRKIDRETRDLLRETFDRVNASFSELFPTLFGGGQARIELTGDEILDAGVLVIAQPPGKKTSSIHLLSGGEKALSALSLVFALFQLNPAPFCLLDEVDAPLDDANTERYARLVRRMSETTQFLFISHNRIAMEMAQQLIGITMAESGVSRMVSVDIEEAVRLTGDASREESKSA